MIIFAWGWSIEKKVKQGCKKDFLFPFIFPTLMFWNATGNADIWWNVSEVSTLDRGSFSSVCAFLSSVSLQWMLYPSNYLFFKKMLLCFASKIQRAEGTNGILLDVLQIILILFFLCTFLAIRMSRPRTTCFVFKFIPGPSVLGSYV